MNNQFDELTKDMAQTVTRCGVLRKFGHRLEHIVLAMLLVITAAAADLKPSTSTLFDPAGDAVFPYDLYNQRVPPYLDVIRASVSSARGIFHFEMQMSADIPANPDPGFTPSVNHLGSTVALLTDAETAVSPIHFFGHSDHYMFNYYVGALYSIGDSGVGLGFGWHGFLIDLSTFTAIEVPMQVKKDTLIVEVTAAAIGNPASLAWVVASECDPVPIPEEKTKGVLLIDFVPDHGYGIWSSQ